MLRSNLSYIFPVDYVIDMPSRASTSHIRDEDNSRPSTSYMKEVKRVDEMDIPTDCFDEFNKKTLILDQNRRLEKKFL